MASDNVVGGFIELPDVTKNSVVVGKLPLAQLRFIPRKGERVLISATGLNDWKS